ncbi:photosystem II reaction center protein PsbZ [Leptothermofonsia sichuanensis E412]|jgi:photosystem II PsbZ protein|uniref:photosystem II reaction center protein PsbZ n=1 Tax=Leptothermofonsia sichuanensis TaxID=2917832 RepID=UPI001CA61A3B|nr:photosystem II reaction center protein PsbZ [Leptothermofonsia sichuanensis]QZZ18990.1 photosystem II reaction center protein PsbZ [Leptothermofonsia sichuanensis E412]
MTIVFQLVLAFFVILSFILVVAVPVALASPQNWDQSKRLILSTSGVWAGLVIVLGVLNFLVA